ncbi:MAG: pyruvate, phosphate dikinase [Acidobacteriota bacterium]
MTDKFQFVYEFNSMNVDGRGDMKDLLGGKGAGLAEMSRAGLPVPPGFTLSTEACSLFLQDRASYQDRVVPEIDRALQRLEEISGKKFGASSNALLVSVRSGAKFSMPGMMDTVLNVGLNDRTVRTLAEETGNPKFAYDSYRRLLQMFGNVVLGIEGGKFESILERYKSDSHVHHEIELSSEQLSAIADEFKETIATEGCEFPQEPDRQLQLAVEAVFKSWDNPRAKTYRRFNDIPEDLGTGVNVQMMVFGNRGERSGSGVGFTRSPATGSPHLYGEFLPQAQGEEVVAGTRTPLPFSDLEGRYPDIFAQLSEIADKLEKRYREMQDFEFTMEDGKLFMLQTRDGKRTGLAAVRIAVDMEKEGLISSEEAILRVQPDQLAQLLYPVFKEGNYDILAEGLPASPGAEVGKIVFTADDAVQWAERGEHVILARGETTPDDIHGMQAAVGILTSRGGMTSHAAVVARGMGKCSVVGCESLLIDEESRHLSGNGHTLVEGDVISLDGTHGSVILGEVEKVATAASDGLFKEYLSLVDGVAAMGVRANADTPEDARNALRFGAIGIGLCRTEHMFFGKERLPLMQEMVLAESRSERKAALEKLKAFQREDFYGILEVMDGLPVTVRLLDPPLHEFLPRRQDILSQIEELKKGGASTERIAAKQKMLARAEELKEMNPMLGHRGCRLGITYPEITEMQAEALFGAACQLKKEGKSPLVEVMVPLVSLEKEFFDQASLIHKKATEVLEGENTQVPYMVGTMIELPRAALIADKLARECEFFSFGTNDLTQTTFGFSRDDSGRFVKVYEEKDILPKDPFQTLDQEGVGQLLQMAVERGRKTRPGIKLGICGEHGGDGGSIGFCQKLHLDYVSCSPFRVPSARLAAAQAAITEEGKKARAYR